MRFFTLIFFLLTTTLKGQEVVDVSLAVELSKEAIDQTISTFTDKLKPEHGVAVYRMKYTTTGTDGLRDTASGLLVLPDVLDEPLPIAVYHHGTISGRSAAPSALSGQEYFFSAIMASLDLILVMPDYLGIGESRGLHPYVHAETEGRASTDMILAAKEYLWQQQIAFSDQLFLTGYSQGGHAAMATHKYIQENHIELSVTASVPMSGPYFISGVMGGILRQDQEYFYPGYLVYSLLAIQEVEGGIYDSLEQVFRPEFIPAIETFTETGDGLFDMNRELLRILKDKYKDAYPKHLFLTEFYDTVANDPDHRLNVSLRKSDLHSWAPQAPVLMLYCKSDEQVPYSNSVIADSTMKALGATDVSAMDVSGGQFLSHTQCVLPALLTGIPWIIEKINRSTTSNEEINLSERLTISPNPFTSVLRISADNETSINKVSLYDVNGRLVHQPIISKTGVIELQLDHLSKGVYYLQITTNRQVYSRPVFKAR